MNDKEWAELVDAIHDEADVERRVAAAEMLKRNASARDLPRLMDLLKDSDWFAREAAAWPISELAGVSALPELLLAYRRNDEDELTGDLDGFATLLMIVADMQPVETRAVLGGLAASGDAEMRALIEWLMEFCAEPPNA